MIHKLFIKDKTLGEGKLLVEENDCYGTYKLSVGSRGPLSLASYRNAEPNAKLHRLEKHFKKNKK